MVGELYGRVLIKWINDSSHAVIRDDQFGLKSGRWCGDQIFAVGRACENRGKLSNGKCCV